MDVTDEPRSRQNTAANEFRFFKNKRRRATGGKARGYELIQQFKAYGTGAVASGIAR